MYFIQLFLTRACNQMCYYCSTYSGYDKVVDIDYLKWVLDQLPDNTGIELTGGEIGLIENIDTVYRTVKDHPKIKHIIALSNGLLRKCGVDWLNEVEYWEHLIKDVEGTTIKRFYDDLDLEQKHKYIIVTSELTVKSLLQNWDLFKDVGMFRPNFHYKLINHKMVTPKTLRDAQIIGDFWNDLFRFYTKLGHKENKYQLSMLIYFLDKQRWYVDEKLLCSMYSPNPFINLQTHEIGHCAVNVNESLKDKFNYDNLQKVIYGKLKETPYCKKCYTFDNGKGRSPLNNRSYKL